MVCITPCLPEEQIRVRKTSDQMTSEEKQEEYSPNMDSDAVMLLARTIIQEEDEEMEEFGANLHLDEDMDILGDPEYVAAVAKESTPCAAVRRREDLVKTEEFYDFVRRTNVEQDEILRETVHRTTNPGSKPLGTTVHAAFNLMRHNDEVLRDSGLNTFRPAVGNVKCVILDEVSMLSADTFDRIDSRLRQITYNYNEPFGGLHIVMCGDLRQLRPLRATVQQKDASFSTILTKIGDGRVLEPQDISVIESRFVTADRAAAIPPSAIRIFYANKEVDAFNIDVASQCVCDAQETVAIDSYIGYKTSDECVRARAKIASLRHTETGNLPRTILLARGAVGVLHKKEDKGGNTNEVVILWLNFDGQTGRLNEQFPVVQASAVTVLKSQGATYFFVVDEYDRKHPQQLVYVALSLAAGSVPGLAGFFPLLAAWNPLKLVKMPENISVLTLSMPM
ncbi:hypothetical protein HPB47_018024 [Ixodes persulcatus]|uniref:Uncharacterized protein n=1 Tax=Ixodes persulcatus TaxID=34615 RepID=A0AC60QML6_IXOPE|nr:hypothetical protein HPB47_018024 [Ixodes persulcatus]